MRFTPLQWLLTAKVIPDHSVREALGGCSRQVIWRLRTGDKYPTREEAEVLIALYAEHPVEIDGELYTLDWRGCFEATIELRLVRVC